MTLSLVCELTSLQQSHPSRDHISFFIISSFSKNTHKEFHLNSFRILDLSRLSSSPMRDLEAFERYQGGPLSSFSRHENIKVFAISRLADEVQVTVALLRVYAQQL